VRAANELALQETTLVVTRGRSTIDSVVQLARLPHLCALLLMSLMWCLSSMAQTTQYNGIESPATWPPIGPVSQAYKVPDYLTNPPAVIPIDVGRQLFVDNFLIEQTTLTQRAHRPVMYANNPVLAPGGPDLKGSAFPYSDGVWYDPADHLFKMWYFGGYGNMICYAYSTDGKNWIKPSLRDAVVPGTNMVLQIGGQRDSDTVWMDLDDPNPARKFKAFALASAPLMNIYFSPDGIHWSGPQVQTIDSLSDRTTVFRNPFRKVWVDSARMIASLPPTGSILASRPSRLRFYSETSDFNTWNPANPSSAFWTGPDEKDPPYSGAGGALPELYNLDAVAYESVMVGLFSWWNPGPAYDSSYGPGPDLVELGVGFSRDGFSWVRPTRGGGSNAFIPATNAAGTWNAFNTQSAGGGFLVVGDELWFYFSGRTLRKPSSGIGSTGLATLRRDGFYSMDAGSTEGVLTTRPIRFSSDHLFVNVQDPQGSLQAEITDASGNVIAPFTRQNSVALSVDKTLQEVTWNGVSDLSSIANQPVKVRFYLTNGALYSFWVSADASGASHGYVAAGGPGFTGNIDTVGSGGGSSPVTPPVVNPSSPSLAASPVNLNFSAVAGSASVTAQAINIVNTGSGNLNWSASSNQSWIKLSSSSGTAAGSLNVSMLPSSLAAGSYLGTVTISAPGANPSVQTIGVTLNLASVVAPPPIPTPVTAPPTDISGLIGYWQFDDAVSTGRAIDQSGNHLDGGLSGGIASVAGVVNQALSFDGRSGYVRLPDDSYTDLTGNLTLALWVKTLNNSRSEALISRYAAGGAETGYLLRTDAQGQLEVRIGGFNGPSGPVNLVDTGKPINDGQWHHAVAVITLGHGVDFYVDGTFSSTQLLNITSHGGASALQFGLNPWNPYGTYFTGSLDDVRIFNRVISAAEVATLFAAGNMGVVATPMIAPAGGTYNAAVNVSVTSPTSGSSIHYTTDGSEPSTSSPAYVQALTVASTATVKAKAVRSGMKDSGTASSAFVINSGTPSSSGPVGHWTFNSADVTGTQILDRSGNQLNGTLVGGITPTAGVMNQALSFDGVSGNIQFQNDTLTDLTSDMTLAAWIKTSNNSRSEAIISRYAAGGSETGYLFRTDSSGHLEVKIGGINSAGRSATLVDTGKTINDGHWHHVAAVLTLGQGVSFYIDGSLSSHENDNISSNSGGAALLIGNNGWADYGNHFTGSMDDVNIYNRALTAAQVAALANVQVPVDNTPPSLSVAPVNLSFTATVGTGNPSSQTVAISNLGGGTLAWTASSSQTWITLSSTSGTAGQTVKIGVNNNLAAGTYSGTVTIAALAGTPSSQAVHVSFVVSTPPVTTPPVTTPPVTTPPVTTPPVIPPPVTNGAQHYVASNGSPSGDGSLAHPWDIQTAFNNPSSVKPGDTIWLRGGTYGDGNTIFASHLAGSATAPIIVRQYPGERATINGGINTNAPYTWYWGFEVMNTNTARVTGNARPECVDAYPGSTGVKFINLTLHDCMQGIGFWIGAINTEAYGNLIYFNGQQGTTRGMGHGTYTQNETGTKLLADNIIFSNFDINMQFYGSGASFVKGIDMDGNASFNAGSLAGAAVDNIIFAVGSGLDNISVKNSYTYHTPSTNRGYSRLGWQFGGSNGTLTATGNYWIGGEQALQLWGWQHATFTNNVTYSAGSIEILMNTLGAPSSQYVFDQNTYYGSGIFNYQGQNQGFSGWKSLAQVDAHSQFTPGRPTGVWTFVRPNKYEAGRANIIIYNWDMKASSQVDVSSVLKAGDSYIVRDAQNYFGAPVASGTYTGAPIAIPMQGLSVAQPVGQVPSPAVHTSAEFGTFILIKQ
jgi:Concanavalin A-like lectin/glucanases superfamily/Chitobiase/beta-hexosaminidase C-terminal domain/Viral BACON domain